MKVQKSLEKPTRILGMRMQELGVFLGLLLGLATLISLVRSVLPVSRLVYVAVLLLLFGVWLLLRWGERQRHPAFLISLLSWTFYQPRRILFVTLKLGEKNGRLQSGISRIQPRKPNRGAPGRTRSAGV